MIEVDGESSLVATESDVQVFSSVSSVFGVGGGMRLYRQVTDRPNFFTKQWLQDR